VQRCITPPPAAISIQPLSHQFQYRTKVTHSPAALFSGEQPHEITKAFAVNDASTSVIPLPHGQRFALHVVMGEHIPLRTVRLEKASSISCSVTCGGIARTCVHQTADATRYRDPSRHAIIASAARLKRSYSAAGAPKLGARIAFRPPRPRCRPGKQQMRDFTSARVAGLSRYSPANSN